MARSVLQLMLCVLHFRAARRRPRDDHREGRIRYTGTMEDLSRDLEIQKEYLSA
jgi:hypothetical protein